MVTVCAASKPMSARSVRCYYPTPRVHNPGLLVHVVRWRWNQASLAWLACVAAAACCCASTAHIQDVGDVEGLQDLLPGGCVVVAQVQEARHQGGGHDTFMLQGVGHQHVAADGAGLAILILQQQTGCGLDLLLALWPAAGVARRNTYVVIVSARATGILPAALALHAASSSAVHASWRCAGLPAEATPRC